MTPNTPVIDGLQISNWTRPVLEELRDARVDAVNATCAVWENAAETVRSIAEWYERERNNADLVGIATSIDDVDRIRASGRVAVLLGFQNTSPFEDDHRYVEVFHRLGVRIAQLTYNNQNLVGGGCFESADAGLTRYGHVVVSEMNRLGMLIDCSHVGDRTTRDAIDASEVPVAVTHANPRSFHDTPRNKPDDVLDALTARGGMLGLCLYPTVIGGETVPLRDFCDLVVRSADRYGIDRIGLGSDCTRGWDDDFVDWLRNGRWRPRTDAERPVWPAWPSWFSGPADLPRVAEGLSSAGLTDDEVGAVLGGNWHRFLSDALRPAAEVARVHA